MFKFSRISVAPLPPTWKSECAELIINGLEQASPSLAPTTRRVAPFVFKRILSVKVMIVFLDMSKGTCREIASSIASSNVAVGSIAGHFTSDIAIFQVFGIIDRDDAYGKVS